eukprot:8387872-Alexandrium_andersonii.AAC.1
MCIRDRSDAARSLSLWIGSRVSHKRPRLLGFGQQWKVGDGPCSCCHTMVLLVSHRMATHAATRRALPLPPRARCVRVGFGRCAGPPGEP